MVCVYKFGCPNQLHNPFHPLHRRLLPRRHVFGSGVLDLGRLTDLDLAG